MTRLALAFSAGAGASLLLPSPPGTALLLLLAAAPIGAWLRPGIRPVPSRGRPRPRDPRRLLLVGAVAGFVAGAAQEARTSACPPARPGPVTLTGRLLTDSGAGAVPFVTEGAPGCAPERVWSGDTLPAGVRLRIRGERREGWGRGLVLVRGHETLDDASLGARVRWAPVRWREELRHRLVRLYGPRAGLVSALVLARREGLDPELRAGFARAGIAHLLAISGFHVGVVAGLLYALLRALPRVLPAGLPGAPAGEGAAEGAGRRGGARGRAGALAAAGSWIYVGLLGFPDAAARAAFLLTFVALARLRGRPPARWSALGAALLILVASDPSRVASPGVQLSFLGAAGLVAGRGPLEARLRRLDGGRLPGWLRDGVAAGAAATLATLPVVAWHFEEVSLVGIPATLVASPLVSLALPGALATLALEPVLPGAAAFLAGGVDLLLVALAETTARVGSLEWAAVWIPREWTAVAAGGAWAGWATARRAGLGAASRRLRTAVLAVAMAVGWPLLVAGAGRGRLELRVLDVGQGDAIALRTPGNRWVLVDAGPPWEGRGPGPVVGTLRRLGVARLEALILTHPDADHIGGATQVLAAFEVGSVLDPAVPTGKEGYVRVLAEARARGVPWRAARAPLLWTVDGVSLEVLHPSSDATGTDSNDRSVVLRVRWGAFDALLTGDAPAAAERAVAARLPRGGLEVLKVGHHGSDTSTDPALLRRTEPRVALVSVGRGNRYGHPAPAVLGRLEAEGVAVHRTDREGTLRVEARRDGRFRVVVERAPPSR